MTVIIEVNNSYSQIKNLNTEQFKQLKNLLSYDSDPTAKYFAKSYNTKRYLIDVKGYFPTGLLHKVRKFMAKTPYQLKDLRIRPKRHVTMFKPIHGVNPYPDQIKAVDAAVRSSHMGSGLIMPTGSGKSITMALLISQMQMTTLVVVPNLELKVQLSETFTNLLGPSGNWQVLNIDSPLLETATDFDMLILDECHGAAAKTYQKLNKKQWTGIYHRFFFTATFFRNQDNEQLLFESICGQPVYELTYRQAVQNNLIVPVDAYYLESPAIKNDCYTYQQFYKELVVENELRNHLIADTMTTLHQAGVFTLCLVKEVKHGEILSQLTGIPFANGADDESRIHLAHFKDGLITSVIATEGIAGTGCDTKPCEYVIIAGLGKAKSGFLQKCGRATRRYKDKESAKVIIIKDNSHKFSKAHFKEQVKILKEAYNIVPTKL